METQSCLHVQLLNEDFYSGLYNRLIHLLQMPSHLQYPGVISDPFPELVNGLVQQGAVNIIHLPILHQNLPFLSNRTQLGSMLIVAMGY